jgi:hypothetical protein
MLLSLADRRLAKRTLFEARDQIIIGSSGVVVKGLEIPV